MDWIRGGFRGRGEKTDAGTDKNISSFLISNIVLKIEVGFESTLNRIKILLTGLNLIKNEKKIHN